MKLPSGSFCRRLHGYVSQTGLLFEVASATSNFGRKVEFENLWGSSSIAIKGDWITKGPVDRRRPDAHVGSYSEPERIELRSC